MHGPAHQQKGVLSAESSKKHLSLQMALGVHLGFHHSATLIDLYQPEVGWVSGKFVDANRADGRGLEDQRPGPAQMCPRCVRVIPIVYEGLIHLSVPVQAALQPPVDMAGEDHGDLAELLLLGAYLSATETEVQELAEVMIN